MNYLTINEETLSKLQSFESIEEMNEAIRQHKQANELTQTERDILDVISRYACKYKGVAYPSKNTLADAVGKSRRTVIRACNRLEELGIIKQYPTKRIKGDRRQSSNIIVIKRASTRVTPECHSEETTAKANINNTYKETSEPSNIIKRSLRNAIPTPIFEAMTPFFDGQGLYDTYGILLRAKAKIDASIALETHADRYIDAFYNVIRLYKAGKVRRLNGLLYVAWERLSAEISRQINAGLIAKY